MPSYQSFGSGDIICTFNGQVIAELLSITWSVTREKAPNYILGHTNPVGYARGRRGIAGSLVFALFNRNALIDEMKNADKNARGYEDVMKYYDFKGENGQGLDQFMLDRLNPESNAGFNPNVAAEGNDFLQRALTNNRTLIDNAGWVQEIEYADQILPFNITVNGANEAGAKAKTTLIGVEILNEGSGISIQDLATSQSYTFVARDIQPIQAMNNSGQTVRNNNSGIYTPYGERR